MKFRWQKNFLAIPRRPRRVVAWYLGRLRLKIKKLNGEVFGEEMAYHRLNQIHQSYEFGHFTKTSQKSNS